MFRKLFSLYPVPGDAAAVESRLGTYIQLTEDIHPRVISEALARIVQRGPRPAPGNRPPDIRGEAFLPPISEIRRECAQWLRQKAVEINGDDYDGRGDGELHVEGWLNRGQKLIAHMLPAIAAPSSHAVTVPDRLLLSADR